MATTETIEHTSSSINYFALIEAIKSLRQLADNPPVDADTWDGQGSTVFDVAHSAMNTRMQESTTGPINIDAATNIVGALDESDPAFAEAVAVFIRWTALNRRLVTVYRSILSAVEKVLLLADLTPDVTLADLPQSPWYAREVDAEFEVDPIPITATPHLTHGPPALAPVLLSAVTQGYRAA